MTALQDSHHAPTPAASSDDALCGDWLGLAGYLAEAVGNGDITVEAARSELAAEATGGAELRVLGRALEFAATQFGVESMTTTLLASVYRHVTPTAGVA